METGNIVPQKRVRSHPTKDYCQQQQQYYGLQNEGSCSRHDPFCPIIVARFTSQWESEKKGNTFSFTIEVFQL
jgi:hypothetical protein